MKPTRFSTPLVALALAVATFSALPAAAAPPSDAQIDRLLVVMRAQDTVAAMLPQIEASQRQMVAQITAGQTLTAQQQASFERIMEKSNARIRDTLTWKTLEPIYRDIYRQTFSAEDVDAMVGFYGSPAGGRVLDKMPQLIQQSMGAMQQLVVPMLKDMQRDIAGEAQADAGDADTSTPKPAR